MAIMEFIKTNIVIVVFVLVSSLLAIRRHRLNKKVEEGKKEKKEEKENIVGLVILAVIIFVASLGSLIFIIVNVINAGRIRIGAVIVLAFPVFGFFGTWLAKEKIVERIGRGRQQTRKEKRLGQSPGFSTMITFFTIFWNLMAWPSAVIAWDQVFNKGNRPAVLIFL